jgi:hypothetical protein
MTAVLWSARDERLQHLHLPHKSSILDVTVAKNDA